MPPSRPVAKAAPTPSPRATIVKPLAPSPLDTSAYSYPTAEELNQPPETIDGYIRCIFGRKGSGKTTLTSQFPDSIQCMFEPRRRNLAIRQLNLQKYTAKQMLEGIGEDVWARMMPTIAQMTEDPSIKNINFDTVDLFYECCVHHVCYTHGIAQPKDAGKEGPAIWNEIRDEWACFFDALAATDKGINLISHTKSRENVELDGGKYEVKSPSCAPACLQYIKQAVDLVFFYGTLNGKRCMQIRDDTGGAEVAVGPQGRFLQPDGVPIYYLEMPELDISPTAKHSTAGYDYLVKAFNNECWDMFTPEDQRGTKKPAPKKGPPTK